MSFGRKVLRWGPVRCAARRISDSRGSALVEFVALALVLLIPSVYLVVSIGQVQRAAFAADLLARDSARILAVAPDLETAQLLIEENRRLAGQDYRLREESVRLSYDCLENDCFREGGYLRVRASIPVTLPLLPHGPQLLTVNAESIAVLESRGKKQ
ncbi:TadE/TadG family type IV pilus assembly protein [Dermabacteraceae bacterium P13077]